MSGKWECGGKVNVLTQHAFTTQRHRTKMIDRKSGSMHPPGHDQPRNASSHKTKTEIATMKITHLFSVSFAAQVCSAEHYSFVEEGAPSLLSIL